MIMATIGHITSTLKEFTESVIIQISFIVRSLAAHMYGFVYQY